MIFCCRFRLDLKLRSTFWGRNVRFLWNRHLWNSGWIWNNHGVFPPFSFQCLRNSEFIFPFLHHLVFLHRTCWLLRPFQNGGRKLNISPVRLGSGYDFRYSLLPNFLNLLSIIRLNLFCLFSMFCRHYFKLHGTKHCKLFRFTIVICLIRHHFHRCAS